MRTHTVVIRNAGRRPARNVRLSHTYLPDFNIWPPVQYEVEDVPNAGRDIIISTVVPDQQLVISYLYFPPHTYGTINAGVRHDDGFAKPITVLLQKQYPRWFTCAAQILVLIGISTVVYALFEAARFTYRYIE